MNNKLIIQQSDPNYKGSLFINSLKDPTSYYLNTFKQGNISFQNPIREANIITERMGFQRRNPKVISEQVNIFSLQDSKIPSVFSFNDKNTFKKKINEGNFLIIESLNNSVAHVYFVNELSHKVPMPNGFCIVDNTNNDIKVPKNKIKDEFYLCYSDNYTFFIENTQIMKFTSQRQWAII